MSVRARVQRGEGRNWFYEVRRDTGDTSKVVALGWDDNWRAAYDRARRAAWSIAFATWYDETCTKFGLAS